MFGYKIFPYTYSMLSLRKKLCANLDIDEKCIELVPYENEYFGTKCIYLFFKPKTEAAFIDHVVSILQKANIQTDFQALPESMPKGSSLWRYYRQVLGYIPHGKILILPSEEALKQILNLA